MLLVSLGCTLPALGTASPSAAQPSDPFSKEEAITVPAFGKVTLYRQTATPDEVVLFVSGDGGWNQGVVDMARQLSEMGALVAGVSIIAYEQHLAAASSPCSYPASDFEYLSKTVQQHCNYASYKTPMLIGYSSGATLVYATLVQAPPTTFKGAISLGFCPDLPVTKPFCKGSGLACEKMRSGKGYVFEPASSLEVPWIALQGTIDQVCDADSTERYVSKVKNGEVVVLPKVGHGYSVYANWMPQFKESYRKLSATAPSIGQEAHVEALPDLPLVEVPATGSTSSDAFALHITGDGGWGVTDRGIAETLATKGIPVVGFNSLHYFWKARTPEGTTSDIAAVMRHYLAEWKKDKIVLIGYSFGADVLPYVVNDLPADLRSKIALVVFMGLGPNAEWKFHLTNWLGGGGGGSDYPTRPLVEKMRGMKMLCFYGKDDQDTICRSLPPELVTGYEVETGHRFGSHFENVADEILSAMP